MGVGELLILTGVLILLGVFVNDHRKREKRNRKYWYGE
jgi:hypothetical protein